jgi:hypothetical protein
MEDRIWVAIHPRGSETRVLATAGAGSTLLKARLVAKPWHQRALPSLLEALALWQSRPVHAVLVVDKADATFVTSLCPDLDTEHVRTPLYTLDLVEGLGEVLRRIGDVLDRSIEGAPMMREVSTQIDLSKIDFAALAARFKDSKTKNLDLERLKAAIRAQLDRMIAINETRVDLRKQFETLIDAYNAGSTQIEQLFLQLLRSAAP